jgi:hypothetical protein
MQSARPAAAGPDRLCPRPTGRRAACPASSQSALTSPPSLPSRPRPHQVGATAGKQPLDTPNLGPVTADCAGDGRALSFVVTAGLTGAPAGLTVFVTPFSVKAKPKVFSFKLAAPILPFGSVQFPGSPPYACTGKCLTALNALKAATSCDKQSSLKVVATATKTDKASAASASQPFTLSCATAPSCTGL